MEKNDGAFQVWTAELYVVWDGSRYMVINKAKVVGPGEPAHEKPCVFLC